MSEKFRIFVAEPLEHPAIRTLQSVGEVSLGPRDRRIPDDELAENIREVHALLITSRDHVTRAMIEGASKLRVIAKFGARPENVDWDTAKVHGVRIVWTPESNSDSVAEYAVLLVLAHLRRLLDAVQHLRRGGWRNTFPLGRELRGKVIGLVGLGNVGSRVARCLSGFQVTLLGYDPYLTSDRFAELGVQPTSLPDLLRESDIVSLHAMVTAETQHLINEDALRSMKRDALLVNTARGALVDENALARALEEKWIGGACLDVFAREPVADSERILSAPEAIVSPHIAAMTAEALDREITWTVEDVIRVLRGQEPVHSPSY